MRDLDDITPQSPDQGFQFPGVFEITAMGRADGPIVERVPAIIAQHGMSVIEGSLRTRPSREGNYVSVTVSFTCPDREHYDAAHESLRADPSVKWTL